MNSKKKTIILIITFVAIMIGASYLYTSLSGQLSVDNLVTEQGKNNADSNNSENSDDGTTIENVENSSDDVHNHDHGDENVSHAPDFKVYDTEGNEVTLSSYLGKPIILNFWASWCGPCKSEMPDFDEAYNKYKDDIHFLMVNLTDGSRETIEVASSFIEEQGYSFPILFDSDSNAAITYSVSSIPTTYFIDSTGHLVAHAKGAIDGATLQKGIDMIFSE